MPDLLVPVEWRRLLQEVDFVVHLAAIAHATQTISAEMYDLVNHQATRDMATAAAAEGVKRFVFVSSIGAQTGPAAQHVITEADAPVPSSPYGRSKLAAEAAVAGSGVPFTNLRPTLVYGTGAKGNLASLMRLAASPLPLPFGHFKNRRSLLSRENLISAIHFALTSPATPGETFVVADPIALTLAEIVTIMRTAKGQSPRLLPIPHRVCGTILRALGRSDFWDRIGGSLVVDPAKLLAAGWHPLVNPREGLAAMVRAFDPRAPSTGARKENGERPRDS